MIFQQGDSVVHHNFGVGTITSIEKMTLAGNDLRTYYRVDFSKTTIWVPVRDEIGGGLRPITPKTHLIRYRAVLTSSPALLDTNFRKRQGELEARVQTGTFEALCEVVRDLRAREAQKPLSTYEKNLLKQSQEALVSEWSISSGMTWEETMTEIDGCLLQGKLDLRAD